MSNSAPREAYLELGEVMHISKVKDNEVSGISISDVFDEMFADYVGGKFDIRTKEVSDD